MGLFDRPLWFTLEEVERIRHGLPPPPTHQIGSKMYISIEILDIHIILDKIIYLLYQVLIIYIFALLNKSIWYYLSKKNN